ncbi:MAG: U32 family peptidase [Lachnospiraceae bacterium]|nr:U32 family peptidase [Lachnospiraceae bacterium]
MPELLIPARDPETLRVAVLYGADAVYIGGERLSLRAKAGNFTLPEMAESAAFAHERGVKVYVAANVFARDGDIAAARELLPAYAAAGADGFIISDPGMFRAARECAPEVPIHISTQANNTNAETWRFWYDLGVKRLVAARELSLAELRKIRAEIPEDMEIECFVHGAMCISYSGRCLISSFLTGRDANRGACTHPCRFSYRLEEATRPGTYFPVEEDARGTYLYFSKDLCMIDHLPELAEAGIDSLKVEGRMKNALYVAGVARAYRRALDDLARSRETYEANVPSYLAEIRQGGAREFCTGSFFGQPDASAQDYEGGQAEQTARYLGLIERDAEGRCFFRQKNKFSVGDEIVVMRPDGGDVPARVRGLRDAGGRPVQSCPHPGQVILPDLGIELRPYDILRTETSSC